MWPKGWMGVAALAIKIAVIAWLLFSTIGEDVATRARVGQPQVDTSRYLLLSRGFHWISEYPYNR